MKPNPNPLLVALFEVGKVGKVWEGTLAEFCKANEYDWHETFMQFTPGSMCIRIGGGAAPEFRLCALNW